MEKKYYLILFAFYLTKINHTILNLSEINISVINYRRLLQIKVCFKNYCKKHLKKVPFFNNFHKEIVKNVVM